MLASAVLRGTRRRVRRPRVPTSALGQPKPSSSRRRRVAPVRAVACSRPLGTVTASVVVLQVPDDMVLSEGSQSAHLGQRPPIRSLP